MIIITKPTINTHRLHFQPVRRQSVRQHLERRNRLLRFQNKSCCGVIKARAARGCISRATTTATHILRIRYPDLWRAPHATQLTATKISHSTQRHQKQASNLRGPPQRYRVQSNVINPPCMQNTAPELARSPQRDGVQSNIIRTMRHAAPETSTVATI